MEINFSRINFHVVLFLQMQILPYFVGFIYLVARYVTFKSSMIIIGKSKIFFLKLKPLKH